MNLLKKLLLLFILCFPIFLLAQNDTCNYKIQLIDFFGDGWDGAELTVVIQGDTSKYTLPDSIIGFVDLPAIQNERLQIFFSAGSFDEEISYIVFDPAGGIIFNDGPNPQVGLVVDIIACPSCPAPTNLQVNTSDREALLQWKPSTEASRYLVEYGEKGFLLGDGMTTPTTDSFIIIPDLLPFTAYDFYVWPICNRGINPVLIEFGLTSLQASVSTKYAKDVGIALVTMPNAGCGLTDAEMIQVELKNFGANPQSLIPFRFSVNGIDGGVMIPSDGFYTNVLSQDSSVIIEFETTYDFSQVGTYEIAVWTELEGDNQLINDTAYLQVQSIPTINQLPYSQDFEVGNSGWLALQESVGIRWKEDNKNQAQTYPFYGGQNSWLLVIDSMDLPSSKSYLYSPCLDFTDYETDLKIAFQLLVNTTDADSKCWLESSINEGENWQRIEGDSIAINWYNNTAATAWTNATNAGNWRYVEHLIPNSAQEANLRLRIVFENGANETGGQKVVIDDVQIFPPTLTNIVALRTQNTARQGCGLAEDKVEIELYNAGANTLTGLMIHYQINNGSIISQNLDTLVLASGDQKIVPFQTPFSALSPSEYTIKSWVSLTADELPINDTAYYQFTVNSPLPLPLVEDFEDQSVDEGWFAVGNAEVAIRGPFDHNNDSHILATNLWSSANRTAIHTANYGQISEGDSLSFDYRFVLWENSNFPLELDGDSLVIEISNDCGDSFTILEVIHAENHIPSTDFFTKKIDLSAYSEQNAVFRFTGIWGHNDFWLDIDNITVLPGEQTTSVAIIPELIREFKVYPNPTASFVQVDLVLLEKESVTLQVLNRLGQIVWQKSYPISNVLNQSIDLSHLSNGVYLLKAAINQTAINRKLIKVD